MELSDFECERDVQPDRKQYPCYMDAKDGIEGPVYLLVSLERLREAMRGNSLWADTDADRNNDTFKPDRYERAVAALVAGNEIITPWLIFRDGRIRIMDGRHRLYALIDQGYTHVRVVTEPWHVPAVRTLVEMEDGGPSDSGRQEYLDARAATMGQSDAE